MRRAQDRYGLERAAKRAGVDGAQVVVCKPAREQICLAAAFVGEIDARRTREAILGGARRGAVTNEVEACRQAGSVSGGWRQDMAGCRAPSAIDVRRVQSDPMREQCRRPVRPQAPGNSPQLWSESDRESKDTEPQQKCSEQPVQDRPPSCFSECEHQHRIGTPGGREGEEQRRAYHDDAHIKNQSNPRRRLNSLRDNKAGNGQASAMCRKCNFCAAQGFAG